MGTVKYPAENGEKAGKALIQLVPMFSDLYVEGNPAKRIAGLVGATLEGVETITIWEVTGDFNDAMVRIGQIYLEAMKKIDGAVYETKVYMSTTESFKIIPRIIRTNIVIP